MFVDVAERDVGDVREVEGGRVEDRIGADRQESLAQYARELMLEADGVGSQLSGA